MTAHNFIFSVSVASERRGDSDGIDLTNLDNRHKKVSVASERRGDSDCTTF